MATQSIGAAGDQVLRMPQRKVSGCFAPALRDCPRGDPRSNQRQANTGCFEPGIGLGNANGAQMIEDYIKHQANNLSWRQRDPPCLLQRYASCETNCTHATKIAPAVPESYSKSSSQTRGI
ncbi:hypothetical protein [Paenarthrobacter aurescens]|uniref:hypothetical protein n=1 Tax=Paenarthrobacter aurescens TaxID=43663 RepID=UPI0031D81BA2